MKIDPPPEPVNEPPVTPVPSRKRPEDIETAPSFGAWTSPAFFQRSHASFGGLVDSSVDPFAEEEDGFIPGKGRKRPRFSMRSSEWRVVDEPASPGEKASPVDWTEELEAEVDEDESAAENIEIPQRSPEPASVLPDTQETLDSTSFGYSATSTGQLAPETGPTREEPVEPLTPTPASYVNGKEDLANSLQIPISSPHLRPVPSPGLPVPSPFASSTPGNGYLISDLAPTTQPSTTVTQSHEVIGDSGVPKVQTETVHVDTEDSNLKTESVTSFPGHTAPVEPQLQTASEITEQVPEDVHSEEEEEEEEEEITEEHMEAGLQTPSGLETPADMTSSVPSELTGAESAAGEFDVRKHHRGTRMEEPAQPRSAFQVIPETQSRVQGFFGGDKVYNLNVASDNIPLLGAEEQNRKRKKPGDVDVSMDPDSLQVGDGISKENLQDLYESQRQKEHHPSWGFQEDLSDMIAQESRKRLRKEEERRDRH